MGACLGAGPFVFPHFGFWAASHGKIKIRETFFFRVLSPHLKERLALMRLAAQLDDDIKPHLFTPQDFDARNPLRVHALFDAGQGICIFAHRPHRRAAACMACVVIMPRRQR